MDSDADFCQKRVRESNRDRYLSTLYAPEDKRRSLFALYAFNCEIADIVARARDALPGEIRIQWWREVLSGGEYEAGGSPVACEMLRVIELHNLPISAFENYLDARISDLYADPYETRSDLEAYCGATAAALIQLSVLILDPEASSQTSDAAGHGGCAQAMVGLMRLLPFHCAHGKCFVPEEILRSAGLDASGFLSNHEPEKTASVIEMMIAIVRDHLKQFEASVVNAPVSVRAAFLPVALAPAFLRKIEKSRTDPFSAAPEISELSMQWQILRHAMRGW